MAAGVEPAASQSLAARTPDYVRESVNSSKTALISSDPRAAAPGELVLPLTEIAHLFNAPKIDPLSHSPTELLGLSGVDYLLDLLQQDTTKQRAHTLVLLLAPGNLFGAQAEQTGHALHRLAEARIEWARRDLSNTCRHGWKVAGIALVLLAICIALSSIFTSDVTKWMRPLPRSIFERGFEIIGWVMLWHPIEVLGFTPLAARARIGALRTLAGINVVTRPGPGAVEK
jgi:hypothetical protein